MKVTIEESQSFITADGSIMTVSMEHRFQRVEANELVVKRI